MRGEELDGKESGKRGMAEEVSGRKERWLRLRGRTDF